LAEETAGERGDRARLVEQMAEDFELAERVCMLKLALLDWGFEDIVVDMEESGMLAVVLVVPSVEQTEGAAVPVLN